MRLTCVLNKLMMMMMIMMMGASNAGGVGRNRDSELISGSIACLNAPSFRCNALNLEDHSELMTLVDDKRRSLLMAEDDDEEASTLRRRQQSSIDNRTAFNYIRSGKLKPMRNNNKRLRSRYYSEDNH